MAKFLTTAGNSHFIEQIILNAESSITIVTPYLKLSQTLLDRIRDADKSGINITLIYGKIDLSETEKKTLKGLNNLEIYFCFNLHAKCYHNENSLIISSMNLYEFSEKNNREMGILIDKNTDILIYNETLKEIESIKNASKKQKSFFKGKTEIEKPVMLNKQLSYNEVWNFHLPSTYKLLTTLYPSLIIKLTEEIKIEQFPQKGIRTEISGRIDMYFDEPLSYKIIQDKNKANLKICLPKVRFFWNKRSLNIYLESSFADELTLNGTERKAKRFVEIITTIADNLKI